MAEVHDDWLGGLGIDVGAVLQRVRDAAVPTAMPEGLSSAFGGAAGRAQQAASDLAAGAGAAWDQAGQDLKAKARDTLLEGVGAVSGIAKQATEVVDTGLWLGSEYKKVRGKVAALGGEGGSVGNQVAGQALDAVVDVATLGGGRTLKGLGDLADQARQAGLVDKPAPGQEARASLTAPLAGAVNDLAKKIEAAVGGTPAEPALFTPLEKAEIASALAAQTALAFTGAEEVKVALNVAGALQSVRGIVESMRHNKSWKSDPAFWSGVIGIVLSLFGLKHSAGASKFTTLLMRFGWTAQVVPLLLQMNDAYFAEGLTDEEREQKVKAFWTQVVTVLKDAILHVAQSQGEAPARAAAGDPEAPTAPAGAQDEPFVVQGNAVEGAAEARAITPETTPPEGFEATAHGKVDAGPVRRVRGLQSSGEQSRSRPKPGTLEGLEHPETAGAVRGREVTPDEQRFGIPSSEDWEAVRRSTPTAEQRDAAQKALPAGSPDPALPHLTVGKAQPDHIVSVDRVRRMPGFAELDAAAQIQVLNLDENLAPLGEGSNQAKGGKSVGEFSEGKGMPVDPAWRAEMLAREEAVLPKIQRRIDELLREQWAKAREPG
ncbi:MAG: hypothetical protein JNN18_18620 [Rubrivivax sp.]|nr:hypothetical protein [Rubrivivax sp.]